MRHRRWTRGDLVLLLLVVAAGAFVLFALAKSSGDGSAQAAGRAPISPAAIAARGDQELAALRSAHEAYTAPAGSPLRTISATRPITGERTVLPVLRTAGGWLKVELPGRPNGLTGWIERSQTKLEYTPWRIVVSIAKRRVYAYDAGRLARTFSAVVGAPATPTPKGRFFVEENVLEPRSTPYYPYALALSARSNVYTEFDGGPGQIAIHGLANIGGIPGTADSHGCVRLDTANMTWLADRIDPGVPVIIH